MTEVAKALPVLSSDEIVARLVQGADENAAIAFDADGTLWSGDIGVDTFETLLEKRAVRPEALAALLAEAASYGVVAPSDPSGAARALYEAFDAGTYPEAAAFQMMAWAFAGFSEEQARTFALSVIESVSLGERLHPEVLPIVRFATDRSIPLLVVSASPAIVVRAAVLRLGIPVARVFGMSAAIEHGILLPRLAGTATYGAGKVEALRDGAKGRTLLGAFGDSVYDLPMLAEARVAVAVRPKPELRARAGECPGLVELAPRAP